MENGSFSNLFLLMEIFMLTQKLRTDMVRMNSMNKMKTVQERSDNWYIVFEEERMTQDNGLTEEQKEEIRYLLQERKAVIEDELRKGFSRFLADSAEDTTVVDVELGSESHVDTGKEMSFQVMSRRTWELKQIKEALLRLRTGEYGICDECENPIRFERLKVLPFAQLCRSCQQESEAKLRERQGDGRKGRY